MLLNSPQEVVYSMTGQEVLHNALAGYSGAVLCYGQTGAGKTFTMTGVSSDYKSRGIIPRTLSQLYQEIDSRYEEDIQVGISYL